MFAKNFFIPLARANVMARQGVCRFLSSQMLSCGKLRGLQSICGNRAFSSTSEPAIPLHESSNNEETTQKEQAHNDVEFKREIAELALTKYVSVYGWTEEALDNAISELGLSSALIGLFPHGGSDLVHYFIDRSNIAVMQELKTLQETSPLRGTALIRKAIELRLQKNIPYLHVLPDAMALAARPSVFVQSCERLSWLVDDIWHLVGDNSSDFSWYSKRAMLGSVYLATEFYMLTDRSFEYKGTMDFLDRRLADIKCLSSSPVQMKQMINNLTTVSASIFQGITCILGNKSNNPFQNAEIVKKTVESITPIVESVIEKSPYADSINAVLRDNPLKRAVERDGRVKPEHVMEAMQEIFKPKQATAAAPQQDSTDTNANTNEQPEVTNTDSNNNNNNNNTTTNETPLKQ